MEFADLDGDESADAVLAAEGLPRLEVCRAQAPGRLRTRTVIPIDGPPRALAAADLELDGKAEIVVMTSNALLFVRSLAAGGFDPPSVVGMDGAGLQDLEAADFDGKGRIQIALADLGNGRILVGSLSAAGFAVAAVHKVGDFPFQLAAADLDGDRICDLAVADMGSPSVTLLFMPGGPAQPDGGLRRAELTIGAPQKAIAAADLTADGIPDLAVATRTGIVILTGAGGGDFERKREIALAGALSFMEVGDLGGDGIMDLAAARGTRISIFLDPASGAAPEPIHVSLPSEVLALEMIDADGDRLSDLVAAVQRDILVYRSLGANQLANPQAYRVGESPRALLLTDLDGDETIDCVTADFASKNLSILQGRERRRAWGFLRGDADSSGSVTITDAIRVCGRLFLGGLPFECDDSADADDDGKIDLTDVVCILRHLFLGGAPPPEPGPLRCGEDPTQDSLRPCPTVCPPSPSPPGGGALR